jgi:dCMP deaminase
MNAFIKSFLILHVPVLHQGYVDLFERYRYRAETCYVMGSDMIKGLQSTREIRAMDPKMAVRAIRGLGMFPHVDLLKRQSLAFLRRAKGSRMVVVDDEMSRQFMERYLPESTMVKEVVFLRWDEKSVNSSTTVKFDRQSIDPRDRELMQMAQRQSERTSCWWRHVGAVIVDPQTGKVILTTYNAHLPDEHTPYAVGDPRDFVKAGTSPELASTIHGEAAIVAMAARKGIALKGMHLYVTVFPCTPCAGIVAESGISKVYFASGCAYLEGESILRSRGVEIVHVA